jgi:hypothetical protein
LASIILFHQNLFIFILWLICFMDILFGGKDLEKKVMQTIEKNGFQLKA